MAFVISFLSGAYQSFKGSSNHSLTTASSLEKTASSPLGDLPKELKVAILKLIPLKDLVRCRLVSREWKVLISSDPVLIKRVNFARARAFFGHKEICPAYFSRVSVGGEVFSRYLSLMVKLGSFVDLRTPRMILQEAKEKVRSLEHNGFRSPALRKI